MHRFHMLPETGTAEAVQWHKRSKIGKFLGCASPPEVGIPLPFLPESGAVAVAGYTGPSKGRFCNTFMVSTIWARRRRAGPPGHRSGQTGYPRKKSPPPSKAHTEPGVWPGCDTPGWEFPPAPPYPHRNRKSVGSRGPAVRDSGRGQISPGGARQHTQWSSAGALTPPTWSKWPWVRGNGGQSRPPLPELLRKRFAFRTGGR